MQEIQEQTKKAVEATSLTKTMLAENIQSSENVEIAFEAINSNAENVAEQAKKEGKLIKDFEEMSTKILEEITSISSITEENTASVEEVMASVNQQDEKVADIANGFDELQRSINSLEALYSKV